MGALRSSALAASICAVALLTSGCEGGEAGRGEGRPSARVLVIGWDGATFRMLDPLVRAGRLPNVEALLRRGASARLRSTIVPISSAAWAALTTGKGPGQTGVYSFFEPVEGSYDVRLISARSNRASPIWRILSRHGRTVHVFGVPVTFPPEPVRGTLVAGMLSPFDAGYAWPGELDERLRALGFEPDLGIWRERQTLDEDRLDRQLAIKEKVLAEILSGPDWAFALVVFKSLDVLSHRAYDGSLDGPVAQLYERLDAILGRLLRTAGPESDVFLISDHGFNAYPRGFNLHRWLLEKGYATLLDSPAQPGPAPRGPLADQQARQHRRRIGELDMTRTRAFAAACEGNFGSIRVNLTGREPRGIVAPSEFDALLAELEGDLRALARGAGSPRVTRVVRGRELYPGPHGGVVPDLLFEVDASTLVSSTRLSRTLLRYREPRADHDGEGILIAAGPSIRPRPSRLDASVLDLTPTALHLLGLPVYSEMEGRVLEELLGLERPVRRLAEAEDPAARDAPAAAARALRPEERRELEERLRALGYVQ